MTKHKRIFMVISCLGLFILTTGCIKCIKVRDIPPTSSTLEITKKNVVIKAAILPNGNPVDIEVMDYCPSGDGINEIVIGWSKSNEGGAEHATINFPPATFGDGPSKVFVTFCHFFYGRLEAYDKNGNLVSALDHTNGQNTLQTLTLAGGKISRIDIIGAEIGIRKICYRR